MAEDGPVAGQRSTRALRVVLVCSACPGHPELATAYVDELPPDGRPAVSFDAEYLGDASDGSGSTRWRLECPHGHRPVRRADNLIARVRAAYDGGGRGTTRLPI